MTEEEDVLYLKGVHPLLCRSALKGDVDERGRCVVRVARDPDNPGKRAVVKRVVLVT